MVERRKWRRKGRVEQTAAGGGRREMECTWRGNEREDECLCSLWNQVIHTPAAAGAASRYTRGWKRMVIDMKFRSAATDMP